jgi:hypothetical protein
MFGFQNITSPEGPILATASATFKEVDSECNVVCVTYVFQCEAIEASMFFHIDYMIVGDFIGI